MRTTNQATDETITAIDSDTNKAIQTNHQAGHDAMYAIRRDVDHRNTQEKNVTKLEAIYYLNTASI